MGAPTGRLVPVPAPIAEHEWPPPPRAEDLGHGTRARARQLADGATVSVSDEEHYQPALTRLRGTERAAEVVAELVMNDGGNPWAKKPTGAVVEVRVGSDTVGFLTKAMTTRYAPLIEAATRDGAALTAKAYVVAGSGKNGRDVEITLAGVPRFADQMSIVGLNVATEPHHLLLRRTGTAHGLKSTLDAGWSSHCGLALTETLADLILTTKPWVGYARSDGTIVDGWPMWCERCQPGRASVEDGGRFGDHTSIRADNRYSAAMTGSAVMRALQTRFDFDVAGESFRPGYPDNLLRFAEILRTPGQERLPVVLRRDAQNQHDANAIEVHVPGDVGHVGFVPAALARILAPRLDGGSRIRASAVEVRVHGESPDRPGLTVSLQELPSSTG